ncbi:MAG: DUF389 domain-containing protein [Chloroflexaceae bacterium]|nr:DUF389 domain-containing protein [Chloroflexaceae bacterium]
MAPILQPAPAARPGFDPDYLPVFEDKLFIEGPLVRRRLVNFFVLLVLATVIATYGVLSDSTATVIGAMIVAPLMGPIMATTAAVVMGSLPRALRALALVVAGVVTVVVLSYLLAAIVPDVAISFTGNGEIASRINPNLYALLTALGAGAAGAFITSRAEIADSIGGVAIAISLVPPLCVVGIALEQGQHGPALGAMLLFLTNFLAILLAGGIVFVALGLGALALTPQQAQLRRRAFTIFAAGMLIVALPLSVTSYHAVQDANDARRATGAVEHWLEGADYDVLIVNVNGQEVRVAVEGAGELKPAQELADSLAEALNRPVIVVLRTLYAETAVSKGP